MKLTGQEALGRHPALITADSKSANYILFEIIRSLKHFSPSEAHQVLRDAGIMLDALGIDKE